MKKIYHFLNKILLLIKSLNITTIRNDGIVNREARSIFSRRLLVRSNFKTITDKVSGKGHERGSQKGNA